MPQTVKVNGTITYGGGSWPHTAKLTFVPAASNEQAGIYSATAEVKPDGQFEATTFSPGDGLVPGVYHVAIQCWDHEPADGPGAKNFAPQKFQTAETSGLEVKVDQGTPEVKVTWDVPKS